jgi:adenosine deaminase
LLKIHSTIFSKLVLFHKLLHLSPAHYIDSICPCHNNLPINQPTNQLGMNVSLTTDDPMQFHSTQEPLIEEYTMAKQV